MYNSQEIPGSDMDRAFKGDEAESKNESSTEAKAESGAESDVGNSNENGIPQVDPKRLEAMVAKFQENRKITEEENDKKDAKDIAALREQIANDGKAVNFNIKDLGLDEYIKNAKIKE